VHDFELAVMVFVCVRSGPKEGELTMPEPFVTEQVCEGESGCVFMVTSYAAPDFKAVANLKVPLWAIDKVSRPFWSTTVPATPAKLPPTE
jgi:hypothetical protein